MSDCGQTRSFLESVLIPSIRRKVKRLSHDSP